MKKIKILTIVLTIILVTLVAFGGIFVQVQNRMENKVKDYSYNADINGTRNIRLVVNKENKEIIKDKDGKVIESATDEEIQKNGYTKEEVPYNKEEVLNVENYEKSKKIIEERFNKLGIDYYNVSLDEETGDILIELEENTNTDSIISNMAAVGKFEIIDSETNEVLLDNSDIKLANVMYGYDQTSSTSTGTNVYLNIEFTKDGAKKLEEISNTYTEKQEENEEENNTEENNTENENAEETEEENTEENTEEETKKVTMKIDDEEIMTTSFDEPIKTGKIQLSVGKSSTDTKTLQGYANQASNIAVILDRGNMPIKYEIEENEFVMSEITDKDLQKAQIAVAIIALLAVIVLIVRYKIYGLLTGISFIGFAAVYSLIIRYTNVVLSLEGLCGIAIILILNYIFVSKLLNNIKKSDVKNIIVPIKDTYNKFFMKILPVGIVSIVFCFINWASISSFGMTMFWGLILIAIYNLAFTVSLLNIKEENNKK